MTASQVVMFQVSAFLAVFLTFRSKDRGEGDWHRLACEVFASVAWATMLMIFLSVLARGKA